MSCSNPPGSKVAKRSEARTGSATAGPSPSRSPRGWGRAALRPPSARRSWGVAKLPPPCQVISDFGAQTCALNRYYVPGRLASPSRERCSQACFLLQVSRSPAGGGLLLKQPPHPPCTHKASPLPLLPYPPRSRSRSRSPKPPPRMVPNG